MHNPPITPRGGLQANSGGVGPGGGFASPTGSRFGRAGQMTPGRRARSKNRRPETASVSYFYLLRGESRLGVRSRAAIFGMRPSITAIQAALALAHAGAQQLFRDPVLKSVMKLPQDWAIC